jgi:hypothetical protein
MRITDKPIKKSLEKMGAVQRKSWERSVYLKKLSESGSVWICTGEHGFPYAVTYNDFVSNDWMVIE